MADASYLQTSFLGGEWSPLAQGRMADPTYRAGMNVCRNGLPIEEGSWVRRPGSRLIGPTRKGRPGVLRAFDFEQQHPYNLELTAGHLRFLAGAGIVTEAATRNLVIGLSATSPVSVQTAQAHGLTTGNEVVFIKDPASPANASIAALLGRQIEVTVVDATHFTCVDAVTGVNIDGTSMVLGTTGLTFERILDLTTPYAEQALQDIRTVQDQTDLVILHGDYKPQAVISTHPEQGQDFAVFTFGPVTFKDGPYLDPPTDGTTITSSGLSGSVTLTLSGGSTRFAATDVGRLVRLFSEPAAWASGTSYAVGDQVKFNNAYYQALKANSGKQPDADVVNWAVSTTAAQWTWAIINTFTDSTHATATLQNPILRTTACTTWRLGLFSDTTGYPTNGTYHEGRLFLAGVLGNRMDGSKSNDPFNFEPTAADGTVADDNAVAYVFNAKDVNQIFWMEPDPLGIVCGTQAGEWLVQASAQNDILTPTSVQAHRRTTYGCANVAPRRAGITIAFVQRYQKKVLEYITTDFRGLSAHNLSITGKHLTQKGVVELAYQAEKVPTIWARTADGALLSCAYRREQPYASEPPDFSGWARHDLGAGLKVESLQSGPNFDGTLDAVSLIVNRGGVRYSILVTDLFDVDWTLGDSFFVDFGEAPSEYEIITGPPQVLRLYSLHYLAGQTVSFFVGGIDAGDHLVNADGHVDIAIDGSLNALLTNGWLASLNTTTNFHGIGLAITATPAGVANNPTITGVLEYDPSLRSLGISSTAAIDWDGFRMLTYESISGFANVEDIRTGNIITQSTDLSFAAGISATWGEDGYFYAVKLATNCATLTKLDPTTLAVVSSFGLATAGFSSSATTWAAPRSLDVCIGSNGSPYMVSAPLSPPQNGQEIAVLHLGNNALDPIRFVAIAGSLNSNEIMGNVCRGTSVAGWGRAWIVGGSYSKLTYNAAQLGLYEVIVGEVPIFLRKGSLAASLFGPGWTHLIDVRGIVCDETDGNLIIHVVTSAPNAYNAGSTYGIGDVVSSAGHDYQSLSNGNVGNTPASSPTFWQDLGATYTPSGATETRICKIDVGALTVPWSVLINNSIPSDNDQSMELNQSRVRNSKYLFADNSVFSAGNYHLHQINTATGVDTTQTYSGLAASNQASNSVTGQLIIHANFTVGGSLTSLGRSGGGFTNQWCTLAPDATTFPPALPPADAVVWTVPVAIGYTYPSQGQILRPIAPQETGAQNGPALAKTRRTHMFGTLLQNAQGISFGTDFSSLRPGQMAAYPDGPNLALNVLFSGVHQDTLEDDYTFNSMLCWEIDRPYPATVCTIGAFLHTQDR